MPEHPPVAVLVESKGARSLSPALHHGANHVIGSVAMFANLDKVFPKDNKTGIDFRYVVDRNGVGKLIC